MFLDRLPMVRPDNGRLNRRLQVIHKKFAFCARTPVIRRFLATFGGVRGRRKAGNPVRQAPENKI
jgi:hypothetical protein